MIEMKVRDRFSNLKSKQNAFSLQGRAKLNFTQFVIEKSFANLI